MKKAMKKKINYLRHLKHPTSVGQKDNQSRMEDTNQKELFEELMEELKGLDYMAYDIFVARRGLHEHFQKKNDKIEKYNASKAMLIAFNYMIKD
jgi:hypothetical protein